MSILGTDSIERTQVRTIALKGFDGPAMASLELFLSKESNLRIVGIDQADLLIVNGDQGINPDELKVTYTQKHNKPGILISVRDLSWPGFVLLKKPYSTSELIKAIRKQLETGDGGDKVCVKAEARVAAVMGIEQASESSGSEAYKTYMARAGVGQETLDSIQSEKLRAEQLKQQMRERLRRGKVATQRAAEKAGALKNIQPQSTEQEASVAIAPETDAGKHDHASTTRNTLKDAESEVRELLRQAEEAQRVARENARQQQLEAQQRVEAARKELALIEAKKREEQRKEAERLEAERREAVRQEALRKAAEKKAAEKRAAERKALADKKLAEKRVLEKRAAEKQAAEQKARAEKEALKKKQAAEKAAKERTEADVVKARELANAAETKNEKVPVVEIGELKLMPEEPSSTKAKAVAKPATKQVRKSSVAIDDDEMIYRCCGNLADVDVTRPDERRRIYFNTDGALLYWLPLAVKKARLSNTPVEISGLPRCFVYLPEEDRFFGDFGEDLLLQYALSRFGFGELDLGERLDMAVSRPEVAGDKQIIQDRDAMIWKIALWTARGRLNQRMDPEKVYKLKERPDFSRMIEMPHASEIAELWFDHRLSALDVVRILNVPQRYVFAFMSGADALGWLQE
ncbi:hypothetical protein QKW35_14170 [Pontibacterium granulatum]|uniref:hypothetical protein n=1 Tax=Pontibacterium granulatum TaxID=2036029 RepID=UPI00249A2697|nr:hypothetical protein [Pontibacterium granulatum]MDI3325520.1 hypothetical protein [Pontibacterium granulatum]